MDENERLDPSAGSETDEPVDGPGRGEPGDEAEHGAASQGAPGAGAEGTDNGGDDEPGRGKPEGERRSTNEVADEKVRVVEPGAEEDSPRA